jgi:hypothetical protein
VRLRPRNGVRARRSGLCGDFMVWFLGSYCLLFGGPPPGGTLGQFLCFVWFAKVIIYLTEYRMGVNL